MKRFLFGMTILGAAAALAGCPIYSDNGNYRVCNSSGCYDCPDPSLSSACIVWQCNMSTDCGSGFACIDNTCSPSGFDSGSPGAPSCSNPAQCASGWDCGTDGTCHAGSCETWGCSSGYRCFVPNAYGAASCVAVGAAQDASPNDAAEVGPFDGAYASDAVGPTSDGGDASPPPPALCNADGQCGGGGARCIDGRCTAQSGLCSDGTQCASEEACVNGVCTPRCGASAPCPIGFGCDLTRGVCSLDPTVCATSADCNGGTVCVESYCVPPCGQDDAASACPAGQACVNGGCIPDQAAMFTCKNDGYIGAVASTCDSDSICLHGDCYVECDLEGGACADAGGVCKQVTTAQGTFSVCAEPSDLGGQCDPATGSYCGAGLLCIDGYCD